MSRTRSAESPAGGARVAGRPGEWPLLSGVIRIFWPTLLVAAGVGFLLRAAFPRPALSPVQVGFGFLLLAALLGWVIVRGERQFFRFWKGARGEDMVARLLSMLPAEFDVYHGVPVGGGFRRRATSDIDHIVVGPGGVFVIETKNWAGRVRVVDGRIEVDGQEPDRPPLVQVKAAAQSLSDSLQGALSRDLSVQPVVCFAEGRLDGGRTGTQGVVVCNTQTLHSVLRDSVEEPLRRTDREQIREWLLAQMNEAAAGAADAEGGFAS